MFELPEYTVLSQQINQHLVGKIIQTGNLGNSPHKFVWNNVTDEEFAERVIGKQVGESFVRGRWLFVPINPGYSLILGECGGKLLYHQPGSEPPAKYHLFIKFSDGSFLTETTQMWGAIELYAGNLAWEREYIKDMRPSPLDSAFTFDYFIQLVDEASAEKKTSVKALLTQGQLIPGLGNASAQDIMFFAKTHPKQDVSTLNTYQRQVLYDSILTTVAAIIEAGGRYDEFDLFGEPGGYVRVLDKYAVGTPCPKCGSVVEKFAYLGGTCYICPECQKMSN